MPAATTGHYRASTTGERREPWEVNHVGHHPVELDNAVLFALCDRLVRPVHRFSQAYDRRLSQDPATAGADADDVGIALETEVGTAVTAAPFGIVDPENWTTS